jgi:hypothetical protein
MFSSAKPQNRNVVTQTVRGPLPGSPAGVLDSLRMVRCHLVERWPVPATNSLRYALL